MVRWGLMRDRGFDVPVVGRVVFALDGEGRDAFVLNQRRGDIILGAQRI